MPARQKTLGQNLSIRTSLRPDKVAATLVREIHAIDPNLAPSEIISAREQIDRTTSSQTIAARLLAVFGSVALLLSAIGLYGLMSFSVQQSTREMGLRMALGATQSNLLRLVVSRGLMLTTIGVALGLGVAVLSTRLMGYLLYQVSPRDPLVFGAALSVMFLVAVAACFLPAFRAMKTDPIRALRT